MRGALVRSLLALSLGAALLAGILYYASTVDARPPVVLRVVLTQHLSSDAGVALTTSSVEVHFSEAVEHASAQEAFVIEPSVRGSFSWSGAAMTFTPSARLALSTAYAVHVEAGVRDRVGNAMAEASHPTAFQTVGNPFVIASDPAGAAADVALDAVIQITFSTLMDTASVERTIVVSPATQLRLRWNGERLTVQPVAGLLANRHYLLQIGADARDQAGTPLAAPYVLAFDTVPSGLEISTVMPASDLEGVDIWSPIAVLFDRPLDPGSVSSDLLSIVPSVDGSLDAIVPPGAAGLEHPDLRLLRFRPSGPLAQNTTYEVRLATGLRGADGSRLATGMTWTFTTGAPRATLSNQVVFLSTRSGVANLWAMNPDGSSQRQLSAELSAVVDYAVAPDGRSFVVGDGAVLVFSDSDGRNRRLLTEDGLLEFDPTFTADGSQLAFGRADLASGAGLGLWIRPVGGGAAQPIRLPEPSASATPQPSPVSTAPLLRAPSFSPDGARLAFIGRGSVGILDLASGLLQTVLLDAVSPPVWVSDSRSLVLTELPGANGASVPAPLASAPVAPLSPAGRRLAPGDIASLRVVRVAADGRAASALPFGAGVSAPAVDASGRFAYLNLDGPAGQFGRLWATTAGGGTSIELLRDDDLRISSASFAPQSGSLVADRRLADVTALDPRVGIWLVEVSTGRGTQLAGDGWLPRWLP